MSDDPQSFKVEPDEAGQRLDHLLQNRAPDLSRRQLRQLFERGQIQVDGRAARKGTRATAGSLVSWQIATGPPAQDRPQLVEASWLHVDDALIVVDKPAGLPCHPLDPGEQGTLVQQVSQRFPEVAGAGPDPRDGGLLHRLDNQTSGVVALARNALSYAELRTLFSGQEVSKDYLALVEDPDDRLPEQSSIRWPLGQLPGRGRRMVVLRRGDEPIRGRPQPATSELRCLLRGQGAALVAVRIQQGRRHQIRAHLAALGHPVLGDLLYGQPREGLSRQALHAHGLSLPAQHGGLTVRAPFPPELADLADRLGMGSLGDTELLSPWDAATPA